MQARLLATAAETRGLQDVAAIKRLQAIYGYYLDRGMWNEIVDLFADDGSIEFGNEGVYVGKEHVRAYFSRLFGGRTGLGPGQLNTQLFVMPAITVAPDGKTAQGRWEDLAIKGEYGKAAFWGGGTYENDYVKDKSVWKFKALHRYTTFIAPYDKGWAGAERKPDISIAAQGVPADGPPTFVYEPFPGVFIPPYHQGLYVPANDPLTKGVMLLGDAVRPDNVGPPPRDGPVRIPATGAPAVGAAQ